MLLQYNGATTCNEELVRRKVLHILFDRSLVTNQLNALSVSTSRRLKLAWFHKLGLTNTFSFLCVDTSLTPLVSMLVGRINTIYLHVVVALNFGFTGTRMGYQKATIGARTSWKLFMFQLYP